MESPRIDAIHAQIERISSSSGFQASPRLTAMLRYLAAAALSGDAAPPTQTQIAAAVLQLPDPESRSATAAVRVQVGRLRKLLGRYYEAEGTSDPIQVELPLRDYRLRFLSDGKPLSLGRLRTTDTPILGVAATRSIDPEPQVPGMADAVCRNLLTELGGHSAVTTVGPVAPPRLADGAAGAFDLRLLGPATFMLDTAVQREGDHVRLLAMLGTGQPPRQIWTRSYSFSGDAASSGIGMRQACRKLAADVADECGAITHELLRSAAGKPAEQATSGEAMTAMWRYWMTGSQADLAFAHAALEHALANAPDSPLLLVLWAAVACQQYTSNLDPRARLPDLVWKRIDLARRLALGDPWVELVRGYALWLARETSGLAAILERLESMPASPTYRGMVASLLVVTDIQPHRGRELLATAIAESPLPLLWFHFCAAFHDLEHGDLDAADRELARIDAPERPEPVVIRACVASRRGQLDVARRILSTVTDVLPEFATVGEVILRRWLHDRHVDTIAAALQPLGIDWFHAPRIGTVRG